MDIDCSEFCKECGTILELPLVSDIIECPKCRLIIPISHYICKEVVSVKTFSQLKPWLEDYKSKQDPNYQRSTKIEGDQRVKVQQPCPECNHQEMYFFTLQLRSADEGTTVFYECVKCGHQIRQNN